MTQLAPREQQMPRRKPDTLTFVTIDAGAGAAELEAAAPDLDHDEDTAIDQHQIQPHQSGSDSILRDHLQTVR